MAFLSFCGLSIITSFYGLMNLSLTMFNDVAKEGYIIDLEKFSDKNESSNHLLLSLFIPFINLLVITKTVFEYSNSKEFLIDQLRVNDALKEMTLFEKEEYKKKPTGFNALMLSVNSDINELLIKQNAPKKEELKNDDVCRDSNQTEDNKYYKISELEELKSELIKMKNKDDSKDKVLTKKK